MNQLPGYPLVLSVAATLATACSFSADYSGTAYRCDDGRGCPDGYNCELGLCVPWLAGEDAAVGPEDAAVSLSDSAPNVADAAVGDAGIDQSRCGTIARLVDDFNDGELDDRWDRSFSQTGTELSEQGGQLVLSMEPGSGDRWAGHQTTHVYDARNGRVEVELVEAGARWIEYELRSPTGVTPYFSYYQGRLAAEVDTGSGSNVRAERDYSPLGDRWLRFREESGRLYWETSPDAVQWNELHSEPNPTPMEAVRVVLSSGGEHGDGAATRFDNLNIFGDSSERWCPASSLQDDFADGERAVVWEDDVGDSGCDVSESSGRLVVEFGGSSDRTCGYYSEVAYDLRGTRLAVEAAHALADPAGRSYLAVATRYNQTTIALGVEQELGFRVGAGAVTSLSPLTAYHTSLHRWWAIREQDGTLYFETSADGVDWTTQTMQSHSLDLSEVYIVLEGHSGADGNERLQFDNLNLLP